MRRMSYHSGPEDSVQFVRLHLHFQPQLEFLQPVVAMEYEGSDSNRVTLANSARGHSAAAAAAVAAVSVAAIDLRGRLPLPLQLWLTLRLSSGSFVPFPALLMLLDLTYTPYSGSQFCLHLSRLNFQPNRLLP